MRSHAKLRAFFHTHEFYLLTVIIGIVLLLAIFTQGRFIAPQNIADLLVSYSMAGVVAAGLLVVIISGGIDISFMAVASVSQYVLALLIDYTPGWPGAFLLAGAVGLALGLINALLTYAFKIPAIIVTIGTMNVFYGLLMWLSNGTWLYGFPEWFSTKTAQSTLFLSVGTLAVVVAAVALILRFTRTGRHIFAIGGNPEAARRAGVSLFKTQLFVYGLMGVTAAVGSVLNMYTVQNVAPNSLIGREMDVLAIVVLGGAALSGGRGTVLGTVLGILLFAMLSNGLVMLGISSYWQDVCTGSVILLSFCLTSFRRTTAKEAIVYGKA